MTATRPLAQQLLRTRGQGIAVFVQQRVHSTTVGVEATVEFVQQLLAELESTLTILPAGGIPGDVQLSDEEELELGTLISASSLTIRYVTERDAMTPVVDRFSAAFRSVLRFPLWTKALLGLKMVSLMGATRMLESFGECVATDQVVADLQWLFAQFSRCDDEPTAEMATRINYLFRPACEQLTVAIQSHPACQSTVFGEVVPALFQLASVFGDDVSDGVASELLSTVAVIFDLKLSAPGKSPFLLLPMPAFAQENDSKDDLDDENIHILQREDGDACNLAALTMPSDKITVLFCETIVAWWSIDGRKRSLVANLPYICAAMVVSNHEGSRELLSKSLLSSLESQKLVSADDFDFFQAGLECVRDLGLRDAIPNGLQRDAYSLLKEVMPRLQSSLKALEVEAVELRKVKATCSAIRDVLVETFVWWIHYASPTTVFADVHEEFLASIVDKLADPRVHGDLLFVSQSTLDDAQFDAAVNAAAAPLVRAVKQLDRYSKIAASRIVDGISRVAVGAGPAIAPFADALGVPMLLPIVNGSIKGKSQRQRLGALACILLSCAKDDSFQLAEHKWVSQLISVLLEASAAHSVHGLSILEHLVRVDSRIRAYTAMQCVSSQELVGHLVHNSLNNWPIFTEDVDAVLLVLAILSVMLVEEELRKAVDVSLMETIIKTLRDNARGDDQMDLVEGCEDVLKTLAEI